MNVHEQLTNTVRLIKEREQLQHRVEITRNLIQEQNSLRDQLQKQLALESRDVERLDGITLQNLWHSLRGTKEDAKRKEQEEYLSAKLKYDTANQSLAVFEADLTKLENNLAAMGDLDAIYQQALRDKEMFLLRSGGPDARHLFDIAEQSGCLKAEEVELTEAIDAGKKVEQALSKVQKSLGSAGNWGVVDLLGGGLITTSIKHSYINEARNNIDQVQLLLCNFRRELADVNQTNEGLEIGRLSIFADFILDGLLFDAIVQSKINTAQERTRQLQREIKATMHELGAKQEQNSQKSLELEQERRQIIEKSTLAP